MKEYEEEGEEMKSTGQAQTQLTHKKDDKDPHDKKRQTAVPEGEKPKKED